MKKKIIVLVLCIVFLGSVISASGTLSLADSKVDKKLIERNLITQIKDSNSEKTNRYSLMPIDEQTLRDWNQESLTAKEAFIDPELTKQIVTTED